MEQHPKITVAWTVASLERAVAELGDAPEDDRVRRQFHQLLLALERDGYTFLDARLFPVTHGPGRVLAMPHRSDLAG